MVLKALTRKSVTISVILFGGVFGGALGLYIRDNWDIEAREARVAELEQLVIEKEAIVKRLKESIGERK